MKKTTHAERTYEKIYREVEALRANAPGMTIKDACLIVAAHLDKKIATVTSQYFYFVARSRKASAALSSEEEERNGDPADTRPIESVHFSSRGGAIQLIVPGAISRREQDTLIGILQTVVTVSSSDPPIRGNRTEQGTLDVRDAADPPEDPSLAGRVQ